MPLPASAVAQSMQTSADSASPNGSAQAGKYTLIFTIRHAKTKALLKRHKLIIMPSTFSQETESRTSLYYTKGGIVADTPLAQGIGTTIFNIAGHTGYHGVMAESQNPLLARLGATTSLEGFASTVQSVVQGIGQSGSPVTSLIDGAAAVKDLQDTIRAYFDPSEQPETSEVPRTQDLQLEFLNATAPTSAQDRTGLSNWLIHPHRNLVSLRQDASRPFLYFYTFQFAAIAKLDAPVPDPTIDLLANPQVSLRDTLKKITAVVTDVKNGVNTIRDAFDQLVIQQFTGPVGTLLLSAAGVGDAVRGFADGIKAKVEWPLYAQRLISDALDAPAYAVTTLGQAARRLGSVLAEESVALAMSIPNAGIALTSAVNDQLTLSLNGEDPVTLALGTQTSGASIAAEIQSQVQALTPQHAANTSAYSAFTATYTQGQYQLRSGTVLSEAARVQVVVNDDSLLTPTDASSTLGLGLLNGGQERPGSAVAVRALSLLQGLDEACTHLLAFPDYFAAQLDAQDAQLAARFPDGTIRAQIRGDQHLAPVRILPGDTLQAIASRVGAPWETLALVNNLSYPYLILEPSTLLTGRMSSADRYHFSDISLSITPNSLQGQRVDCVAGAGAGQSRVILQHTATTFVLDHGWEVLPNDTTNYAIRQAQNPILQTSTVTSATTRTLTDTSLSLVPDSQRGFMLMIATGEATGERRRIVENSSQGYVLDATWEVLPQPGDAYVVFTTIRSQRLRQRMLGETLSVPRPSTRRTPPGIRGRLEDVSSITGRVITREDKLFGRDLLLYQGSLLWDPTQQDCVTVAGLENLRQAVRHLVNVPLGQMEYAPGVGSYLHEEVGSTATLPSQMQLLQSVERTIRQDSRIARLAGAEMFTQDGKTFLVLAAQAISGDTVDRIVVQ